jgi:hypothetical protein
MSQSNQNHCIKKYIDINKFKNLPVGNMGMRWSGEIRDARMKRIEGGANCS